MQVLLTANEAYPALERAFMNAKAEIWGSFRIFDPLTRLHSPEARKIGKNWFDLIVHTLARGVAINLFISDFDPVAWAEGHRGAWRSLRILAAAAEIAGPRARLRAIPALHPARTTRALRLIFWPMIRAKLSATARKLNAMPQANRTAYLRELPGLCRWLSDRKGGGLRPRFWALPPLCPATHHQKLAVFDRSCVYIGGLDLNDRRYDTPDHPIPSHETWHDVQIMVEGPLASEAQRHLETFMQVTAGQHEPDPPRHLVRTMSKPGGGFWPHFGPRTVAADIVAAHEMLARRSKQLIYIETQYFRDRKLAAQLAEFGRRRPELCMILILPGAPDDVAFEGNDGTDARFGEYLQARALRILERGFEGRLFIGAAAQTKRADPSQGEGRDQLFDAPIIYIHAKVSIFDEVGAIVSSANLNGRSLYWDTEAGALITDEDDVRQLRQKVLAHWLPGDAGPEFYDALSAVEAWRGLALANVRTSPEKRRGFILPYDVKAAEKFGAAVPMFPDEMV